VNVKTSVLRTSVTPKRTPPARIRACALAVVAAALAGSGLLGAAIAVYPGGSAVAPEARGFDVVDDFVCDLLHATTLDGARNPAAPLARAALVVFAVGLSALFVVLPGLLPGSPAHARLVRRAGVTSSAGWIVVALTASDRLARGHAALVLGSLVSGMVAASISVVGLAGRPDRRALALLGACALVCAGLDGLLYGLLLATGDASLARVVPSLQKLAIVLLMGWALAVALTAVRRT
jgi:hypothetical protein